MRASVSLVRRAKGKNATMINYSAKKTPLGKEGDVNTCRSQSGADLCYPFFTTPNSVRKPEIIPH